MRILIVEDNADLRSLLADVLADAGYEALAVSNGAEALALVTCWPPDAIVLDLMMPVMDGPAFLRERQNVPSIVNVPVLVLTAHLHHRQALEGLHATLVLRKPYDLDDLLAAIRMMCDGLIDQGQAS